MSPEQHSDAEAHEEPVAPDAPAEAVTVRVGGAEFGLPIARVLQVVRVPPITRVPFPPPAVLGVATVRGDILPVLDLGTRLLNTPSARDGRLVVVLDTATGGLVGLLVDAVPGLVPAGQHAHEPPPEVEAALPAGWIAGVVAPDPQRLVTLLHLDPVLALTDSPEEER